MEVINMTKILNVNDFLSEASFHSRFLERKDLGFSDQSQEKIEEKASECYDAKSISELFSFIINEGKKEKLEIKNVFMYIFNLALNVLRMDVLDTRKICEEKIAKINSKKAEENKQPKSEQPKPEQPKGEASDKPKDQTVVTVAPEVRRVIGFDPKKFITEQQPQANNLGVDFKHKDKNPTAEVAKVYDPMPEKTIEEKAAYLKSRMRFLDGVHKNVSADEINCLLTFLDSHYLKNSLRKLGCKANPNSAFLKEVPLDKYNVDSKYNFCFEVATKDKKNPIVVFYNSIPKLVNNQYVSDMLIDTAKNISK